MNERKKVAALKYEESYTSPVVTAAGMGYVADKILEKATQEKVPIVYDKELANLLTNVDIGDSIPYELYDAVAKVIAYVMEIDERIK
ncbi:EscU/YscU/HrcU family type III secretion system export apparatus switch protein [Clostridium sp. Marseille-Q2269]|uniref:EscU/YscU/HrcU family type III secretion system export apparatus switch protein n=1 Tax=Clostridium sp. Marseille-Q2269 TaxID=2942205 RepID=UPI002072BA47|nr:EscU/YscU/HrcU family type III secretion system export apparatus switch protein [Clostridium sp. Marseille-Q2269]